MSPDNEFDTPPPQRFPATPYKAEGGFSVPGLFVTLAICVAAGIVAGLIAAIVGQWFYLILLFPLAMGVIVGIAGAVGVKPGKLRNPTLAFVMGAIGGLVAILVAHYFEFWFAMGKLEELAPGAVELRYSPGVFLSYLDESAKIGVQLKGRGGDGTKLGYSGTYIYWGIELLLVVGIAGAVTAAAATDSFCSRCNNWKKERTLGRVNVPKEVALEVLQSGELGRLSGDGFASGTGRLSLHGSVCPHCREKSTIDVFFKEITVDSKGNEQTSFIARMTYPGDALAVFENLVEEQPQKDPLGKPIPIKGGPDRSELVKKKGFRLDPVNIRFDDEVWKLVFDEEDAVLFDFEDQVIATIPYSEASQRLVFPSFWESVKHFGIQTDSGGVIWFQNDKEKTAKIRKRFGL